MAFCQGDRVRSDEQDVERRVRVFWIYTYSGGFVFTTVLDLWSLAWEQPQGQILLGYCLSMFISVSYLLGNVNFLHQMRCQETLLVHLSAIAKIGYGIAFLAVFIIGLIVRRQGMGEERKNRVSEIAWVMP
mmetsp:Transcript_73329/g.148861  ORF Transcript_73329/g.148861 Transcript_73329/m.148861 type:complete len:131 (+) Transcript_73329:2-394(+)